LSSKRGFRRSRNANKGHDSELQAYRQEKERVLGRVETVRKKEYRKDFHLRFYVRGGNGKPLLKDLLCFSKMRLAEEQLKTVGYWVILH
jgi:hypothetical protein